MNFQELETYLVVADTLNLTRAAENLFISQSTVTHRIKSLEDELGYSLFVRHKGRRNVELTVRGEDFRSIARRWISLYKEMETLKTNNSCSLSIASIDSVVTTILSDVLREISKTKYGLNVQVETHHTSTIYNLIRNRQADIGFVSSRANVDDLITEPVFKQKYVLIRPCRTPMGRQCVHPSELDPSMEIFQSWGYDYMKWHDAWWPSSVTPHIKIDSVSALYNFLEDPGFWSIVRLSDLKIIRQQYSVQVYDIIEGPEPWLGYMIRHKYPARRNMASIEIFDQIFRNFLETTTLFEE